MKIEIFDITLCGINIGGKYVALFEMTLCVR
jgi:hypothetical protein